MLSIRKLTTLGTLARATNTILSICRRITIECDTLLDSKGTPNGDETWLWAPPVASDLQTLFTTVSAVRTARSAYAFA